MKVKQTGTRQVDEALANKAAGLKETPEGSTWHHVEDMETMQLVPTEIHKLTGHSGGVAAKKATLSVAAVGAAASTEAKADGILGTSATWADVGNFLLDALVGVPSAGEGSDVVPQPPATE